MEKSKSSERALGTGFDLRVNLMVAVLQLAAIVNVRTTHRASASEGDGAGGTGAVTGIAAAVIRATDTVLHLEAVASGDAIAHVEKAVGRVIQARFLSIGQHP